jgi:hypothetical protein
MAYGPIDLIALEFKGNKFKGEIMPALIELAEKGIVRVIDLVIIQKMKEGHYQSLELQQMDKETINIFNPLQTKKSGMILAEDVEMIAQKLEDNSTAAILLFENLWVVKFRQAVQNAGGGLMMQVRIPEAEVEEALKNIGNDA